MSCNNVIFSLSLLCVKYAYDGWFMYEWDVLFGTLNSLTGVGDAYVVSHSIIACLILWVLLLPCTYNPSYGPSILHATFCRTHNFRKFFIL